MIASNSPAEVKIPAYPGKALLVRPPDASGAGVIYLHWFDEAPNANRTQFVNEATALAGHGVTSLLPQLIFPWAIPPESAEADILRIGEETAALRNAVDLLEDAGGVDPSRIAIVGHDFGAMHGTLLAAEFDPACVVVIAATPRWADWFLRFWPIAGDRFDYLRALDPLDPINAVKAISAPLLFQFGRDDFYIAAMTGTELFEAATEPRAMNTYEADHSMSVPEAASDRLEFLSEHLGFDTPQ